MRRPPVVNYALLAANVLVYVMGFHSASAAGAARVEDYMLHADAPQFHQFISCVFLHGDLWHLIGNMVFLWVFGNAMNDRLGHAGYLAFYLAGGVLASVGYILMGGTGTLVGASGAIAAVTGAYLVLLPRVRVLVVMWLLFLLLPLEISSLYFLLFQFVFNLLATLAMPAADSGVAYAAHSTGYVFGILVAAALLALKLLPRDPYDLLNLIRAYRRRQSYRRTVGQGENPFGDVLRPGTPRWEEAKAQQTAQVAAPPPLPAIDPAVLELRRQLATAVLAGDAAVSANLYAQLLAGAPEHVLPLQTQSDLADLLMHDARHAQAADAYERFLKAYPSDRRAPDIYLMLGILYGRYLNQHELAQQYLTRALATLSDPRRIELARSDLEALRDES